MRICLWSWHHDTDVVYLTNREYILGKISHLSFALELGGLGWVSAKVGK